jgi:hypothetical protein
LGAKDEKENHQTNQNNQKRSGTFQNCLFMNKKHLWAHLGLSIVKKVPILSVFSLLQAQDWVKNWKIYLKNLEVQITQHQDQIFFYSKT